MQNITFLKRSCCCKLNRLPGLWMPELQAFGMKVHAVCRLSVERIAQDGAVHTIRMSGMDTELVGTATLGIIGYPGTGMFLFIDETGCMSQDLITGYCTFPMLEIDHL